MQFIDETVESGTFLFISGDSNGRSGDFFLVGNSGFRVQGSPSPRRRKITLWSCGTNLADNLHPNLISRWAWNDGLQASFRCLFQHLPPDAWCVQLWTHSPVTRTLDPQMVLFLIWSHYYVSIRSSNASLQNNASQCHYRGWHHMERSRSATFLTLFLTMDSTANTCSPMADSSISACPSVPPASRRPLPPRMSVDGWAQRCPRAVSRTISPTVQAAMIHGHFLVPFLVSTVTLQNLRHICTPRAPRPCVRVPLSSPCAPPTASSLLWLCG